VEKQVGEQLAAICRGEISEKEMECARQMLLSALQAVHDTPGNIEGYYAVQALTGLPLSREEYIEAVTSCTMQDVAEAAKTIRKHTVFFLKGVAQ
jgi:predicted Zn-dependent peptidase